MKMNRFRNSLLLTGLGFITSIGVGLFTFTQSQAMMLHYSAFSRTHHKENIEHLYTMTLSEMTSYIESQYPILYHPDRLRQEIGTESFWKTAGEWRRIAKLFNFAYIFYISKDGSHYVLVMSSDMERDDPLEWLSGQVWTGDPPAYIKEAWETKEFTVSLEPVENRWGKLISGALPVILDYEVVGILGIEYDISFMDGRIQQEIELEAQENILLERLRNILLVTILIIVIIMIYQIRMGNKTVLIPLRDAEIDERTRLMLEATPMMCSLWDTEGNPIDCDGETLKILGLFEKTDYTEHFYDLNPKYQLNGISTRETVLELTRQALESGYRRAEMIARTAAGEVFPVETTIVRVPYKNNYRLAVYSRDLREDKAKEAALQESENRHLIMLDSVAFACFFFDTELNLIDCNQKAVDLFGYNNKNEMLGIFDELSPKYQSDGRRSDKIAREACAWAFKTGKFVFRWEHKKKDGTLLPSEVTLIRVAWKDAYRVVAWIRDLSKLVETEENLRRVLALVEASPNLTLSIGADGTIDYMNPAVSKASGLSFGELQKDGLALLFSSEDFVRLNNDYLAAVKENRLIDFEMDLAAGRGGIFAFSAMPVHMQDGSTNIGIIGRDITDIKWMQQDLASAKDQAERALESEVQYNKAKDDFLSRVSHELRTPLNAILGIMHIIDRSSDKGRRELDNYSTKIRTATEHLLNLVNDILDMTSFDTGKFAFSPAPFSFSRAIGSVIDNISLQAMGKRQVFITNIDDGIWDSVESDEQRLKQVLLKLLSNAVKFTPEGGRIELSARMLKNDGKECSIRFDIIDNGIGISPEALERIGEVFEQADNSITREYGGMGLGLSLTKRIVSLMKGELWAGSEIGKGSHFTCVVRLGVVQDGLQNVDDLAAIHKRDGTSHASSAILNLTGKHLLIVDDVEINREILLMLLEETGAILDEASTGDEAVRLCSRQEYDLVLMDLHMPVMDGYVAAKSIRASSRSWAKTMPIIAVSAENSGELHSKCMEAGINYHLSKPIELEALFKAIADWVPH